MMKTKLSCFNPGTNSRMTDPVKAGIYMLKMTEAEDKEKDKLK